MILSGANDLIQVVTDASADIEISRSWAHNNAGTITVDGGPLASIATPTTTTIVAAAGASQQRSVREISIFNNHASTACTVTVQRTNGTDTVDLKVVVLAAGESLLYGENGIWVYYDSTGKPYIGIGPIATQAEMEAGTSNVTVVTPLRANFHPGVAKAWGKHIVSGGVPAMTVTWNVTSVTDSGVSRVTPVIATDFSSTNYAISAMAEAATTTYSASTTCLITIIRNATQTATQFSIDLLEIDIGQATDPAAWHWIAYGDQA